MSGRVQYTDHELFRLIAGSDEAAFAEIFRRYDRRIYPFVLKMIKTATQAEEITHEIFIKLWRHRERLISIDQPEAYIFTIAARHTLDQIKKRLNESRMLQRLSAAVPPAHNDTEESLLLKDKEALVQQAVDQLPPQQKMVYLLSRQQGLSYDEIASIMNISVKGAYKIMARSLDALKEMLPIQLAVIFILLKYHD